MFDLVWTTEFFLWHLAVVVMNVLFVGLGFFLDELFVGGAFGFGLAAFAEGPQVFSPFEGAGEGAFVDM